MDQVTKKEIPGQAISDPVTTSSIPGNGKNDLDLPGQDVTTKSVPGTEKGSQSGMFYIVVT